MMKGKGQHAHSSCKKAYKNDDNCLQVYNYSQRDRIASDDCKCIYGNFKHHYWSWCKNKCGVASWLSLLPVAEWVPGSIHPGGNFAPRELCTVYVHSSEIPESSSVQLGTLCEESPQRVSNDHRGPGFLAVICFGSTPPPSPVSKLGLRHTGKLRKSDNLLTGKEEGLGEEPNHMITRKPSPL